MSDPQTTPNPEQSPEEGGVKSPEEEGVKRTDPEPKTEDLEEPSTEKEPAEVPVSADGDDGEPEPSHQAVGIGVVDGPQTEAGEV